jgi:hypothetical protein
MPDSLLSSIPSPASRSPAPRLGGRFQVVDSQQLEELPLDFSHFFNHSPNSASHSTRTFRGMSYLDHPVSFVSRCLAFPVLHLHLICRTGDMGPMLLERFLSISFAGSLMSANNTIS